MLLYMCMPLTLDVLSDGTRRHLVALLFAEQTLCVCELVAAFDELQPVISRHLALLRDAGWVVARRDGRRMYYRLAHMPAWAELVLQGFVDGGVPRRAWKATFARLTRFAGLPVRRARERLVSAS